MINYVSNANVYERNKAVFDVLKKLRIEDKPMITALNKTDLMEDKMWLEKMEKIEWARFYAHPYSNLALAIRAAHLSPHQRATFNSEHEKRKRALERSISRIADKRPVIDAETLMREGILPGKQMGMLLAEAERLSINEGIEEKSELIELLKKTLHWQNGPIIPK